MRILILYLILMLGNLPANAQNRLLNQTARLSKCNIKVKANPVVAITELELEYHNSNNVEIEALQYIQLAPGQLITDFYLDLNGHYREGSIEEKWKATNAYNSIVGKRIDPAIISWQYNNYYTLNIYPIPAGGSRKVKIIVSQLMKYEADKMVYRFPLSFSDKPDITTVQISMDGAHEMPKAGAGMLSSISFSKQSNQHQLQAQFENKVLNQPLDFSVAFKQNIPCGCITPDGDFVMRIKPDVKRYFPMEPRSISVYWDISSSSSGRNISKEINFLSNFLMVNKVSQVYLQLFNQELLPLRTYSRGNQQFYDLLEYLRSLKYSGATRFDLLNFNTHASNAVLIFSDGRRSFQTAETSKASVPVSSIVSSAYSDITYLQSLVGKTGGKLISLYNDGNAMWIDKINTAENFLLAGRSGSQPVSLSNLPLSLDTVLELTGKLPAGADQIFLDFGNSTGISQTRTYELKQQYYCDPETIRLLRIHNTYDSIIRTNYWTSWIEFGLQNRVVTPQTSFLVLERIEDYINYKIAPPKDLEKPCEERGYVYRNEYKIQQARTISASESLAEVANRYSARMRRWDPNASWINLNAPMVQTRANDELVADDKSRVTSEAKSIMRDARPDAPSQSLSEVVVVTSAYNVKPKTRMLTTNTQTITAKELASVPPTNIEHALSGKVAGVEVRGWLGSALGRESFFQLRGGSSLMPGVKPLYVVNGTIVSNPEEIYVGDIEEVSVLQGPAASALFGTDGANGAIVITQKKGRRTNRAMVWTTYKLSAMEDVEYLNEIREAEQGEKENVLEKLKAEHNTATFYFDMAMYFHELRYYYKATELVYEGIERCQGNSDQLMTACYIFENWGQYDEALKIYDLMLQTKPGDLLLSYNKAGVLQKQGAFQQAVDLHYKVASSRVKIPYDHIVKEMALADMNSILSVHPGKTSRQQLNHNLIKPLPADIRIVIEAPGNNYNQIFIKEPTGILVDQYNQSSTASGFLISGQSGYYQNAIISEYTVKKAMRGKYRILVNAYNHYDARANWVRVTVYTNYGTPEEKRRSKIYNLENQYGQVEIDQVVWDE